MPTRRVIKSALAGFLGTFTSRYSDYEGYWLLGLVEPELRQSTLDLLAGAPRDPTPSAAWRRLAVRRFAEQVAKSGLTLAIVREAVLETAARPGSEVGRADEHRAEGHTVDFVVRVVLDTGRAYERTASVFIAPHDPARERRRVKAQWGT